MYYFFTVTDSTQSKIDDRYHQIEKTARLYTKKTQKEILVHTISYPKKSKKRNTKNRTDPKEKNNEEKIYAKFMK